MKQEYKGFSIEHCANDDIFRYRIFHVVTGSLAGSGKTISECREAIRRIHESASEYARYAGCSIEELNLVRGRYQYKR